MNSYWLESVNKNESNKIDKNYTAAVCIIGEGICSLNTGYYITKKGIKVIIINREEIREKK